MLTKSKVVSLVGPILILIGLVLPIANTPVHQNSAIYLLNPAYLGLLMLLLALSGVVVALRFSLNLMIAIGLAAFAVSLSDFYAFSQWMEMNNEARNSVKYSILGNFIQSDILTIVEPGPSWVFLVLGALACAASPFISRSLKTSAEGQ